MACKLDVKYAILNKAMNEIEGRYTFVRTSEDTFEITANKDSKARTTAQAKAIAHEVAERISKSFNGHVKGEVSQMSAYDPVTIKLNVNPKYVDYVYDNLPASKKTDGAEQGDRELERNMVNDNAGPNTYQQGVLFDPVTVAVGAYTNYIEFKQQQLSKLNQHLNTLKKEQKKAGLTVQQLTDLNTEIRRLKNNIEGNHELGLKGIKQEIEDLTKNPDVTAVSYYVDKDLSRLKNLVQSNHPDDLKEAQFIIDFYKAAGTFTRGTENPFFAEDEIFSQGSDDLLLDKDTIRQYQEWANTANSYQNVLNRREEENFINAVNTDPSVRKTYGNKQFTKEEITNAEKGLKDIDWVSMWTMDVTNGIFSHNGLIPQIMFSTLVNQIEKEAVWAKELAERVDGINPKVQEELKKLDGGKYTLRGLGITKLSGASYQIFKEITKEGNETGGLVQRFVKEFFDTQANVNNKFQNAFNAAAAYSEYKDRMRAYNKAFEELKAWRRKNTILMDITRLPEFDSAITDMTHKNELINVLGKKGYDEQVKRQEKMLQKYEAERQSIIQTAIDLEGSSDYASLSQDAKQKITLWEHNHSPFTAIEDFHSVSGVFIGNHKQNSFMDYNNFIPRKNEANTTLSPDGQRYVFNDGNKPTGFYSEAFAKIENNPVLSEFYDVVKEMTKAYHENMPYELQAKTSVNTIPALMKSSAEILSDKNTGILKSISASFAHLYEKLRLSFGVNKQADVSHASIDPVTQKPNYKVNDTFLRGNSRAISDRMLIEKTKFLQAFNAFNTPEETVAKISTYTSLALDKMNDEALILLSDYLHIDVPLADIKARRLDAFRKITGDNVQIGKYIRDFSIHSVVQTQSFDLGKITKYFSNMLALYNARQQALPILEIMKKHYEAIKSPKTNNLGSPLTHGITGKQISDGLRTRAIRQMDSQFDRTMLGNHGEKHFGEYGSEIYSKEEKERIKEIDALIAKEGDKNKIRELEKIKEGMGRVKTATALFDNFLGWIRLLRLGYNLSSMATNFIEGVTCNMMLSSAGEYFDPKEIYYGYGVIKHSFLKNVTFGHAETSKAKKNRSLMDKFNVIMDSRNELQKSSHKSYADKLEWLNPYAGNARVEYINQSPIMIAMLRSTKITGKDGAESTLWDAYDKTGHLKDNFKTSENVHNWEALQGDDYLTFKQKLHKAIVLAHGNYDELRGMMLKTNSAGKAISMFKTWLPNAVYWRFATEQDDIQTGTQKVKGIYRSHTPASAMLHGATVGGLMFSLPGAAVGAAAGYLAGKFFGVNKGMQDQISFTKDVTTCTLALVKKMIGLPVNLVSAIAISKRTFDDNTDFTKFVGQGKFTEQDAKNLRSNMADISIQLAWIAMLLLVKGMFWDDDDKSGDARRIAHNILVNRLMQLSSQAAMYINPVEIKKTVTDIGTVQYLGDVGKTLNAAWQTLEGKGTYSSGVNAGQSKLSVASKKILLPGMFKDGNPVVDVLKGNVPSLGFNSSGTHQFAPSPFDNMFHGAKYKDTQQNKIDRTLEKQHLEEIISSDMYEGDTKEERDKAKEKDIRKQLNTEYPGTKKLEKMGVTREEYNEWLKENQ